MTCRSYNLTSTPPKLFPIMPRGDKQVEAVNKKLVEQKEAAIQHTVKLYESLAQLNLEKPLGYRMVCKMVEDELKRRTGVKIKLCHNTIHARTNSMQSHPPGMMEHSKSSRGSLPYWIQSGKGMAVTRRREDHN